MNMSNSFPTFLGFSEFGMNGGYKLARLPAWCQVSPLTTSASLVYL
jgi:hypothetical protein